LIKGHPSVTQVVVAKPMASLCISSVTEGELLYGLARRPDAVRLERIVKEFLSRVDVLSWDRDAARQYGVSRAQLERQGRTLAPLDLMIAAHAQSVGAVLVSNDQAFYQIPSLTVEDWTNQT
jgi:tRNA(fMet)-specific endonuclease VapC